MYNESELYELSFVPIQRRPRTKPQIVISTKTDHLEEISKRLRTIATLEEECARDYCDSNTGFPYPAPDLFGHIELGYRACGLVDQADGKTHFRIELSREKLFSITLTLKWLIEALSVPVQNVPVSNQMQQVDLVIRCDRNETRGYGHAVGGFASPRLTRWLSTEGKRIAKHNDASSIKKINAAMQQTWAALASKETKRWASACKSHIHPDGRFQLECFGDACDLGIYPDQIYEDADYSHDTRFGCHNLDTAAQQLTLLAGLAQLCQLARENES